MIIRPHPEGRLLITQPDHAALAAHVMAEWVALQSPRRADILTAIASHDNGWLEVDAAPLHDAASGGVLDFMHAPLDVRQGVWPRSVGLLHATPYAAALVAQHSIHIFSRFRGEDEWTPFFAQMERMRDEALARSGAAPLDTLIDEYMFVRLGDLISLTFCNAWPDVPGEDYGYTIRRTDARLTIDPDPFAGREVPVAITGRLLPHDPIADAAAARTAWEAAPRITVTGIVGGPQVC
jgi:uncharacterized protein DUF3891